MRAEALVFDVDDTLYDLAAPYRTALLQTFGLEHQLPVDDMFRQSRVRSDEALELLTAGEITAEDHKALRAQWTFADFGISLTRQEALAFQERYARAQEQITPYPQAVSLLWEAVRAGVPLAAISNGDEPHQMEKLRTLGLLEPEGPLSPRSVVISGAYGVNKPDVALFRAAERIVGASGPAVWYVGDTYETDVVGAKRAGWGCLWLDVRGRPVPEVPERPDLVATSVDQMCTQVRGLIGVL